MVNFLYSLKKPAYTFSQPVCRYRWTWTMHSARTVFHCNPTFCLPAFWQMIWVHRFRNKDPGTSFPSGGRFILVCQMFRCTCPGRAAVSQSTAQAMLGPNTRGHSVSTTQTVCSGLLFPFWRIAYIWDFSFLAIIKSVSVWSIGFVNQIFFPSPAPTVWYLSEETWNWDASPFNLYKLVSFH